MNKELKSKIVLKFFSQKDFAAAIGERPSVISNVIRCRRNISDEKKIYLTGSRIHWRIKEESR